MDASPVPLLDLERVADAQRRFEDTAAGLDDNMVRRPSGLPGWSVGHLLTHVARNADSHVRRAEAASRGELVDQYEGGREGRNREIEAGTSRSARDMVADVRHSGERLWVAWSALPDDAWLAVSRDVSGRARRLHELPARRWQELEVHRVDLGAGVSYLDWSDDFVAAWLPRVRSSLGARLAADDRAPARDALSPHDELAWLYGRLRHDELPVLAPWA